MISVIAKDRTGSDVNLDETVVHQFEDRSGMGPDEPMGSSDMVQSFSAPASPSPGQGRYAFGSGARPLDGYTIKRAIGRGGFGEVYYATSDSGKEVALKLILRNLDVERRGVTQCMNLKCPNLLTIYDLKVSEGGDTFVVMEYVAGPSLANVLKQYPQGLPPDEVRRWLKGLVDGVAYLHDHGIVHRDLKPANLFMEEGIVKIGDYGLAKLITTGQGSDHSESIGTCHYMAPEIGSGKYHKPIDIYAMGIILFEMLTGRVPFEGETVNEVLMKHLTSRPDVSPLPEPYRSIVAKALAKDPNNRPRSVIELLPPEDVPKQPDIRIIGEGKKDRTVSPWKLVRWVQPFRGQPSAKTETPKPDHQASPKNEEVMKIDAEEPVYYIGPDTVPPRPQPTIQERVRAHWQRRRNQSPNFARQRGVPQRPAPAPSPLVSPNVRQVEREPVVLEPPPPPTGRMRVAELTTSMLLAAPIVALFTMPAAAVLNIDASQNPQQVAFVFGLSLIGTWVAMASNQWAEAQSLAKGSRRLLSLMAGLAMAGAAIALDWGLHPAINGLDHSDAGLFAFLAFFAILFVFAQGWSGLTVRDRPRRFRLRPIFYTAFLALLMTPLWPYRRPDGAAAVVMMAITLQLASPWCFEAAEYANYLRARQKRQGKARAA